MTEPGLLASTATVTAGNLASRITGFLRVLAVGLALGTTFAGNTYQSANLVSNVVFELLAAGLLSMVLVPPFVRLLDRGRREEAERLAGSVLGLALVVLGVITAAGLLLRPEIMRLLTAGVDDPQVRRQEVELGSFLLVLFLPQMLLYAVGAVATGLLHGERRFAAAAFAPVANNVVVIATMVVFWAMQQGGRPGLDLSTAERLVLGIGTTTGVLAMSLIPLVAVWRCGLRLRPRLDLRQEGLHHLGRAGAWAAGLLACAQVLVVTTLVLANKVEGGVVAYHIAFQVFLLPFALLAHPVITALYPRLASSAHGRHWRVFRAQLGSGLRTVALLTLPASALMIALAWPASRWLRIGNLDAAGTELVAELVMAYGLGLLGYAAFQLLARASYAADDTRTPTVVAAAVAAGGSVLMVVLFGDDGIAAIGLGHSIAFLAGAVVLGTLVWRRLGLRNRPALRWDGPVEPAVAIIPAKDAAGTVGDVVGALRTHVREVIVVDDGSSDETTAVARQAGAWVLRLASNRGKGGAVEAGVSLAPHAGIYLLVDADVGASAAEATALLERVRSGAADMAVGLLPSAQRRGGFGLMKRMAGAGIRLGTGERVQAPLSGQRAVRGELLRSLELAPRFGLEVALTIDARRAGARVVEVPVTMEHRHTGRRMSGFRHRAAQGVHIVRAMWPRLTRPATRLRLTAAALAVALMAVLWSGGRAEPSSVPLGPGTERVLLVSMPGLRWDEVGTGRLPNVDRLLDQGALAAMTVRTGSDVPRPAEAYATLGAGARVRAGHAADEATGEGGPIRVPLVDAIRRAAGRNAASRPGALGDALHAAGRRTAVVNNADTPSGLVGLTGVDATRRPAATALMDSTGRVDAGSVEPGDLLVNERGAPFSERADPARVLDRTGEALRQADVVLVDPGDLDRAAALVGIAPPDYAARIRDQALDWTDAILGRLVAAAPVNTLVLVVAPVPPSDEWRLTPVVAAGPGVPRGYLSSPTTHREGFVTLTDVAPTVLEALGVPVPPDMVGHALTADHGIPDPVRLGRLDRDIALRERLYVPVVIAFVALQIVLYGLAAWVVRRRKGRAWRVGVSDAVLAVAAFPLATLLFRAVIPWTAGWGRVSVVVLPLLMVALVVLFRWMRPAPLAPVAWMLGATVGLLIADLATGGRLQTGGILGYSPQSTGRYFGLGNAGFAVLAAFALMAAVLHVHHAPRRREAMVSAAAFLALVVVVDAAPTLGGDVGGLLTIVPVFGLTVAALAGRRLTWRRVLAWTGATVVVLGAAITVDLLRPAASRTHLGRLAADSWDAGVGDLLATLGRRAESNLGLLVRLPWSWLVLALVAGLAYALLVRKAWTGPLPLGSAVRTGVIGTLAVGVVGFLLNDSGVIVTALALVAIGPVLATVALAPEPPGPPVLLEPAPDVARRPVA